MELKIFIWLSVLTILVLGALFRKRVAIYKGDHIEQYSPNEWDMQRALEDPYFIKSLIGKLNEYQLNISGEIKGENCD